MILSGHEDGNKGMGEKQAASSLPANKKVGYRRGKWTVEEEAYANRLIQEFKLGMLPLTDGTTLRTFLSKLLNCDPMRISKKFVGQNCIGKQVFRRRQQELDKLTEEQLSKTRQELSELERVFLERVAMTNRSQRTSGGVVKNGRLSYLVGDGAPPWMMPPDEPAGEVLNPEIMLGGMTSDALMSGGLAGVLGASSSSTSFNSLAGGLDNTRNSGVFGRIDTHTPVTGHNASALLTGGLDDSKYNGVGGSFGLQTGHPVNTAYVKQEKNGAGGSSSSSSSGDGYYDPALMNPALSASYNEGGGSGDGGVKRSISQQQMQSQIAKQVQIMQENNNGSVNNNIFASLSKKSSKGNRDGGVDIGTGVDINAGNSPVNNMAKSIKRTNSLELIDDYDPEFDPSAGGEGIPTVGSFDILTCLENSQDAI